MKEIKLSNRYGDKNKLVQESDKIWRLELATNYYRVGIIEGKDNEFSFVDPSGGPFISVGGNIKRIFDEDNIIKIEFYNDNINGEGDF